MGSQDAAEQDKSKTEVITLTPAQLAERLDRAKAPFADYGQIKAERDSLKTAAEAAERTESDRIKALEDQIAELTGSLATKETEALRADVARIEGVDPRYATGSTREEMEASARQFKADATALGSRPRPGVVPTQGTGIPDPESSYEAGRARAEARFKTK